MSQWQERFLLTYQLEAIYITTKHILEHSHNYGQHTPFNFNSGRIRHKQLVFIRGPKQTA
jgi:hypothetical protein